jgi:hypothetical protein
MFHSTISHSIMSIAQWPVILLISRRNCQINKCLEVNRYEDMKILKINVADGITS